MKSNLQRYVIPTAIGFAPVVLMLLTWTPDSPVSGFTRVVKLLAAPMLVVELFVIGVAVRAGGFAALRRATVPWRVLAPALGLLTIAVCTAVLVATFPFLACLLTAVWILHVSFGLSVMYLCDREFDRESVTTAAMAGFVVFAILLVIFVTRVSDPAGFNWVKGFPAVDHVRQLGFYAGPMIGLCIGRLALVRSRVGWALTVGVATLGFAIALWTGTRGTFSAVGGALVAGLLLLPALRQRRVLLGAMASVLISLALASWLPELPEGMGLDRAVAATKDGESTYERIKVWELALDAISERPLFGYGEGQLAAVTPRPEHEPHNALVQLLLAWGVVGTGCVLVLAFQFARGIVRGVRALGGEWLPPLLAMMVLVAYSVHDGTLFLPLSLSIFAACVGLVARGTLIPRQRHKIRDDTTVVPRTGAAVQPSVRADPVG
ncbi:O-antigen ligase family protein [Microvirga aerophila]|uniref:O-antigen ligase-related domain-containing protein n=1 Tax=Microvirga aerophila TaxID=670291 RepID=A0A512BWK5_9HYPH|nr:O-antigen ligase family protein [Microvirga aerophila]GEO16340.1 hypothetical protein MAE02_40360 [Microvirga aerophila]